MRSASILAAALLWCGSAAAQNSTQSPPPRADAIGGDTPAGDPNGAVRALGRVDGGRSGSTVTVPNLGGEEPARTRELPAGTR